MKRLVLLLATVIFACNQDMDEARPEAITHGNFNALFAAISNSILTQAGNGTLDAYLKELNELTNMPDGQSDKVALMSKTLGFKAVAEYNEVSLALFHELRFLKETHPNFLALSAEKKLELMEFDFALQEKFVNVDRTHNSRTKVVDPVQLCIEFTANQLATDYNNCGAWNPVVAYDLFQTCIVQANIKYAAGIAECQKLASPPASRKKG